MARALLFVFSLMAIHSVYVSIFKQYLYLYMFSWLLCVYWSCLYVYSCLLKNIVCLLCMKSIEIRHRVALIIKPRIRKLKSTPIALFRSTEGLLSTMDFIIYTNKITANDSYANGSILDNLFFFRVEIAFHEALSLNFFVLHAQLRDHAILKRTRNVCFEELEEVTVTRNAYWY